LKNSSDQARMKGKRVHPPYRPYSQGNPSQVIFRYLLASEILEGSRNSQSCEANFTHLDSPSGFSCIFILHENTYATRVVNLPAGGPDTISRNNFRGITSRITPLWRIISLTLHPLLLRWNKLTTFGDQRAAPDVASSCIKCTLICRTKYLLLR